MRFPTTLRTPLAEIYCMPTSHATLHHQPPSTSRPTTAAATAAAAAAAAASLAGGKEPLELFYLISRFEARKLSARDREFITKVRARLGRAVCCIPGVNACC